MEDEPVVSGVPMVVMGIRGRDRPTRCARIHLDRRDRIAVVLNTLLAIAFIIVFMAAAYEVVIKPVAP
jgi:hypothetical protein